MRLVCTGLHSGTLAASGSFVQVEPSTFVVSAVTQSQDGGGWLVRGYNITGEANRVTLKPWKPFKKVEQVNLAEEKQTTLKTNRDGRVSISVRGHEIVTVRFRD
jgi:alpha-mannosidase